MKTLAISMAKVTTCLLLILSLQFLILNETLQASNTPTPETKEVVGTGPGLSEKENPHTNMALVTAGKVQMGMNADEVLELAQGQTGLLDILARSIPKHTVTVGAFFCDVYEVTNAQWKAYLDQTGQEPSDFLQKLAWRKNTTYPPKEANFPIRNVTLRETRDFARWCGKRLPTEEEWYRAAGGEDGRLYSWGNEWERGKRCTNRRNTLSPVGTYEEGISPFGIHDMTGSVWEWTVTKFDAYPRFKSPTFKVGKKRYVANPGFNPQMYVSKGGHYLAGDLANRLSIREGSMPVNNLDSLGFRCIKDVDPGHTMLAYAKEDLDGSMISDIDLDIKNLYAIEHTTISESDPKVISGFDYFLACPQVKVLTTPAKILKSSPDTPFVIGILSTNLSLEEPNLPPGSYTVAYRHQGLSTADKEKASKKEEAAKAAEEAAKKKKEEEEAKKKEGEQEVPKSAEEIEAERKRKEEEAKYKKELAEAEREDAKARLAQERLGIIVSAKEHIPFPRDKNLIVFMNANDTIVGYLEVEQFNEVAGTLPPMVDHSAAEGKTNIEMTVLVLGGQNPRFSFGLKLRDNPF